MMEKVIYGVLVSGNTIQASISYDNFIYATLCQKVESQAGNYKGANTDSVSVHVDNESAQISANINPVYLRTKSLEFIRELLLESAEVKFPQEKIENLPQDLKKINDTLTNMHIEKESQDVSSVTSEGSVTDGTSAQCVFPSLGLLEREDGKLQFVWTEGQFTTNTPTSVNLPTFEDKNVISKVSFKKDR